MIIEIRPELSEAEEEAIRLAQRNAEEQRHITNAVYMALRILVLIFFLWPLVWMLFNSFKSSLGITKIPPDILFAPTLVNYINVFQTQNFLAFFLNSFIIATGSTFFGLVLGLPSAYSISRYKQRSLAVVILLARMVPGISFLIPWFILYRQFHLIDTYTSLILSHMLVGLPFIVWVMIPFFESVPSELDDAARVDGCSVWGTFVRVILPLSGPGIASASILAFIFSWNNFMFSIVLATNNTKTLPVAIYNFISYAQIDWGGLMAASVVITLPILIIAILMQRFIIRGLIAGAIKG